MTDLLEKAKAAAGADVQRTALWCIAFVTVGVLVGLGKLDPEVLKLMLMAIAGMSAPGSNRKDTER